jgi:O-acetyl-ADP-ribose deacetylase (regulator of RNase III)
VQFTFAVGDLFQAEVDAIVNSEQTDFVLSGNPNTISGQILHRYGGRVQQELDDATKGQTFHAGTVLQTSGGEDFTRIFHAGFHEPQDWPSVPGGSTDADYFAAIGSCIRQVLATTQEQRLRSVAFPLIGTGLFRLNERMLIRQFLDAVDSVDHRLSTGHVLDFWLVIRNPASIESILGAVLELLFHARSDTVVTQIERTSVPVLDRFAEQCVAQRSSEEWAKWQLCRFTEIALAIICFGLSRAMTPLLTPETLFEEGQLVTFGVLRELALRISGALPARPAKVWGERFFVSLVRNKVTARALGIINEQRNRTTLPIADIKSLVTDGLQIQDWRNISETDGELRLADWIPWIVTSAATTGQTGLFERWQKNANRYLVPETGEVFNVPHERLAIPGGTTPS